MVSGCGSLGCRYLGRLVELLTKLTTPQGDFEWNLCELAVNDDGGRLLRLGLVHRRLRLN